MERRPAAMPFQLNIYIPWHAYVREIAFENEEYLTIS